MADRSVRRQTSDKANDDLQANDLEALEREHAEAIRERDLLVAEEDRLREVLKELEEKKSVLRGMLDEWQEKFETMQQDLEDYNEVRDLPEVKAYLEAKKGRSSRR